MFQQNIENYWPQDPTRINWKNEDEMNYWQKRFNTSAANILEAVYEVGPLTIAVDLYLQGHKQNIAA